MTNAGRQARLGEIRAWAASYPQADNVPTEVLWLLSELERVEKERQEMFREEAWNAFRVSEKRRIALEAENARLRAIAHDWFNVMAEDGYDCTCEKDDTCPLCRCGAAIASSLGQPSTVKGAPNSPPNSEPRISVTPRVVEP